MKLAISQSLMDLTTYEGIAAFSRRAIAELKQPNCDGGYDFGDALREEAIKHHELVAEACEKQIAQKPFDHGERCPRCKEIFQDNYGTEDEHCRLCGKKLDWSVE